MSLKLEEKFNKYYNSLVEQQLDEVIKTDYNKTDNNTYYHFFPDLAALLNSLYTTTIYSNKNEKHLDKKGNIANTQFDRYCKDNEAYICMTNSQDGKNWLVKKYARPCGLAFHNDDLHQLCDKKSYRFNEEEPYNQVGEKLTYKKGTRSSEVYDLINFSDFEIFAVGELNQGEFFISGGQGPSQQNLWPAVKFYDKDLYNTLANWFMQNMQHGNQSAFYWFKDNYIGKPTQVYAGKPLNTDGNLNSKYQPWKDYESYKDGTFKDTHDSAISFDIKLTTPFKEILGLGPVNLVSEEGKVILKIDFINPGAKRGHSGPSIYGKNIATGKFTDNNTINPGQATVNKQSNTKVTQQNLLLNQDSFKALCNIYNEHEYRIYIPDKHDFRFDAQSINTIILPSVFIDAAYKDYYDFDRLITQLENNKQYNLSNELLAKELFDDSIFMSENNTREKLAAQRQLKLDSSTFNLIKTLIELLETDYKHTNIEIIPNNFFKGSKSSTAYSKDENTIDEIPDINKMKSKNHTRYAIDNICPDFNQAQVVPGFNGTPSVIAPVEIKPNNIVLARLGAEIIIIGQDAKHKKYVLMVDRVDKSMGFLELPGGGLYEIPKSLNDFKNIAQHRLKFKCGLDPTYIKNFKDSNKSLLLNEKGVAQTKEVTWDFSYYRLYTAEYTQEIPEEIIDYSFDNRAIAKEMAIEGEDGYTAYLKWIPVNSIQGNPAITSRYSNIIQFIKSL